MDREQHLAGPELAKAEEEEWFLLFQIPPGDTNGVREGLGRVGGGRDRQWFVLKRLRCDTHGGSETEVTVTSKLHAQVERSK